MRLMMIIVLGLWLSGCAVDSPAKTAATVGAAAAFGAVGAGTVGYATHEIGCEAAYSDYQRGVITERQFRESSRWRRFLTFDGVKTCGEALDKGMLRAPELASQ